MNQQEIDRLCARYGKTRHIDAGDGKYFIQTVMDREGFAQAAAEIRRQALEPLQKPDAETVERIHAAVAEALGDAYDCQRVWPAWSYGTMGPHDFVPVADDPDRIAEIAQAVIRALIGEQA